MRFSWKHDIVFSFSSSFTPLSMNNLLIICWDFCYKNERTMWKDFYEICLLIAVQGCAAFKIYSWDSFWWMININWKRFNFYTAKFFKARKLLGTRKSHLRGDKNFYLQSHSIVNYANILRDISVVSTHINFTLMWMNNE